MMDHPRRGSLVYFVKEFYKLAKQQIASDNPLKHEDRLDSLREEILKCFGLPFAYTYYEELESIMFADELTVELFDSVLEKLAEHATRFMNPDFPSGSALLENARKELIPADEVIHLLGIYETTYLHYVYECYLMRTKVPVSDILDEMHKAAEYRILIGTLYNGQTPPMLVTETILALKEYGMRYVDGYKDYLFDCSKDRAVSAEIESNFNEDDDFRYPDEIILADAYWEKIYYCCREHFAMVRLYTRIDNIWRKVYVGMDYDQFIAATLQSRSYSRAKWTRQHGKRVHATKNRVAYVSEQVRYGNNFYFNSSIPMRCIRERTANPSDKNFYKWIS